MKRFNKYWAGFAVCSFLGVISLFHINSLWAESTGNGLFIVLGVVFAAAAIYFLKKV